MNKVQMLRLFVCLPKVSRLTACQFCVSNRREKNVRHKSVFERYVDFQIENKVPVNYEGVTQEGQQNNSELDSSTSVAETEQSDKTVGVGQSCKRNKGSLLTNETASDELKTKTQNKVDRQDQVNKSNSKNSKSRYLNKPSQNADENSEILKSKVQIKTPDSSSPLKYILNCELIPTDVNAALKHEDYLLFHECLEKTEITSLPTVRQVISRADSNNNILIRWRKNQIKELGEEGFHNSIKASQKLGLDFHNTIFRYLRGETNIVIAEDIQEQWNSIKHVLESFEEDDIKCLEGSVEHPLLHYVGGYDCIAVYRKTLCIIEWKSSKKQKPFLSTTRNYPLQAAAYIGAVNASFDTELKKLGPVTNAVVVVAYPTGQPAHAHYLTDKMVDLYWNRWLQMLYTYWCGHQSKQNLI